MKAYELAIAMLYHIVGSCPQDLCDHEPWEAWCADVCGNMPITDCWKRYFDDLAAGKIQREHGGKLNKDGQIVCITKNDCSFYQKGAGRHCLYWRNDYCCNSGVFNLVKLQDHK